MREATRAELLKLSSGFRALAVLAVAVALPYCAWNFGGKGAISGAVDPAAATKAMLAYLVACPVAATYAGCFIVTRDYYYQSIERAVLINRKDHVFTGKLITGAVVGLVVGLVGAAGWSTFTAVVLSQRDQVFDLGDDTGQALLGCMIASVLAGAIGVSIGWMLPNYYIATTVSMMLPFTVELPLFDTAPEIARLLPYSALAGVMHGNWYFPKLFGAWLSALIVLLWLALAVFTGWRVFERRELT